MTRTVILFCFLPFLVFLFGVGTAHAAPVVIGCHNCSNAQHKTAAENAIPMYFAGGRYNVYVVDRPKSMLKRFMVMASREPGFSFNFAKSRTPAPAYQQEFDNNVALLDQLDAEIATQNDYYELPRNFEIDSASEVYNNILALNAFNEFFNSEFSFFKVIAIVTSVMDVFWDLNYNMEVRFPDGSTASYKVYRINGDSENRVEWQYVLGSARDSEGNRIPEKIADFGNFHGRYDTAFSNFNLSLFLNAAASFGIPVVDLSSSSTVAVVCIGGAGGTLCEIQNYTLLH